MVRQQEMNSGPNQSSYSKHSQTFPTPTEMQAVQLRKADEQTRIQVNEPNLYCIRKKLRYSPKNQLKLEMYQGLRIGWGN